MVTDFIYPINSRSNYHLLGTDGDEQPITPENLWREIASSQYDRVDSFVLGSSFKVMQPLDRVWIYSVDAQQIVALGEAQKVYKTLDGWFVDLVWDREMTLQLKADPLARGDLWTRVQTTARANERTLAVLRRRLKGTARGRAEVDKRSDERRRVLREVVARQGQGVFRQALLEAYDGRCAISGESCEAVLDAAHIDPYSGPKSNLVSNGLLLRTDLHTLFDLGLLRVDRDYRVGVDSTVVGTTYGKFDGKQIALPAIKSQMPSLAALGRRLIGR